MRIPVRLMLCLLVASAVALVTAAYLLDDSTSATATVGDVTHVMWADVNCDNNIGAPDVLALLSHIAIPGNPVRGSSTQCASLGVGTQIQTFNNTNALNYIGYWGDFDCDRRIGVSDVFGLLKKMANFDLSPRTGCINYGDYVDVTDIPIGPINTPPPIPFVGIDTNTSGNQANSLGPTENCRQVSVGETFDVDVVIKGVPTFQNYAGGLGGFNFAFSFSFGTPGRLNVVSGNDVEMLGAVGTHTILSKSVLGANSSGLIAATAYDTSLNAEHGDGILVRYKMQAVGPGIAGLKATDFSSTSVPPQILDGENYIYPITAFDGGTIIIGPDTGSSCPTPTPSPSPAPTLTPGPGSQYCTSGTPIAIPDNAPNGVTDTKTLTAAGTIANMAMCINIDTIWAGDLTARLTHVDTGSSITLFQRLGTGHTGTCHNDADTNIHVYLTDNESAITESLEEACANDHPLNGTFPPQEPFATFNGPFINENIAGDWKLTVSDNNADGFTAQIKGWKLYFNQ